MKKITEDMVQELIHDQKARKVVTSTSHAWFFHTYFGDYITYETAPFQREILTLTEDPTQQNLVFVAFRGSGKSTIMNLSYPIWSILGSPQKKFVLIVGLTQHQAKQHLRNIRTELESNEILRKDLGPFHEESDEWSNMSIVIPEHNARIMAVSMEQSIRGIRHGSHRPDLIICDDIEDLSSVKTKESRDKTYNWLAGEVIPAGDNNTQFVMIGNLLHEDSTIMRFKDRIDSGKMDGTFRAYPIMQDDKILWEGKYPDLAAIKKQEKKIGDDISWQREYCLRIIPSDDQVVQRDWIQYYDKLPTTGENIHERFNAVGVDLAISLKETADYTAFVPAKVYEVNGECYIYILPNILTRRMDFGSQKESLMTLCDTLFDHPKNTELFIESVSYQEVFSQEMRQSGYRKTHSVKVGQDKRSRLGATGMYIKQGNVLFPRVGSEKLIEQILGFGVEKHDDIMDALTIMVNEVMKKRKRNNRVVLFEAPTRRSPFLSSGSSLSPFRY